jgi:hypothetical protein
MEANEQKRSSEPREGSAEEWIENAARHIANRRYNECHPYHLNEKYHVQKIITEAYAASREQATLPEAK